MKGSFWRGCGLAFFCFWHGSAQGRAAAVLFSLSDDEKSSIRALRLLTEVTLFSNLMPRSSRLYAGVAQLVEQRIRNAKVVGSTPIIGTKKSNSYVVSYLFPTKNYFHVTADVSKFYQRRSILSTDQKGRIGLHSLYLRGCRFSCPCLHHS